MSESESKQEKEREQMRKKTFLWHVLAMWVYVADIAVHGPMRFHVKEDPMEEEEMTRAMKRGNDIFCCVVVPWNKEWKDE